MALAVVLEDEEGVIIGPHEYLLKQCSLEKLEKEVYEFLKQNGSMPLSAIWRNFNCHLWEIAEVLRRLKEKGFVEEKILTT